MRKKKEVLICVPTRNRPEMVAEVLEYELEYYTRLGLDVRYYDSSDDDRTETLIRAYQGKGYSNLSYVRTESGLCIDYKIISIWKSDKTLLDYRYVWLINDSISILEDALRVILPTLSDGYHLVRLPVMGSGSKEDIICHDPDEWFHKCSGSMAHMASTIMSTEFLEGPVDWERLRAKYAVNNDVWAWNHGFFFTVGFYLERILDFPNFTGLMLGNRFKWRRDSVLKREVSYWAPMVFQCWGKSYCDTLLRLPDTYTRKAEVIRFSDNLTVGRFGEQSMRGYRICGLYSIRVFCRLLRYWRLISDVPLHRLFTIALGNPERMKKRYGEDFFDATHWEGKLQELERKLGDRPIIVYGAGLYGQRVVERLKQDGFARCLEYVAVSDPARNIDMLSGVEVKGIHELTWMRGEALVLVATLPDAAEQIKKILRELGFQNILTLF